MNVADSDEMFAHLAARGAVLTDNLDEADTVLINTCTVRDHAEHRAVSFLGRLNAWKKEKPGRVIIFAGCAAQRLGKSLQKKYPFLDILSGAKDIEHFFDKKVFLEMYVKVEKDWRNRDNLLKDFGYQLD